MKVHILVLMLLLISVRSAMAETGATVTLEKTEYTVGEPVRVHFSVPEGLPEDAWIGIVPSDIAHGDGDINDQHDVAYEYLQKKTQGSLTFTAPKKAGHYDFRLQDAGYNAREIASVSFTVKTVDSNQVQLSVNRVRVTPGSEIAVHFSVPAAFPASAWIGLIPSAVPHGDGGVNDQHDLAFQYLSGKSQGSFTFTAPDQPGEYDFRMNDADYGGNEIKSVSFTVALADASNASVTLQKNEFGPGEPIEVTFKANKEFARDAWLGLVPSAVPHGSAVENDKHDLDWRYMESRETGAFEFIAPTVKGQYDFRMHDSYSGREVVHTSFTVTHSQDAAALKKDLDDKGKVILYGLYFDHDKAVIKPQSEPVLEQVGVLLKENPHLQLNIEGHTDNKGEQEYNRALSLKRAGAVRKYLIDNVGIEGKRLSANGYGEDSPVADNATEDGRAKNRRVELVTGK